jgi:hypothetical protein
MRYAFWNRYLTFQDLKGTNPCIRKTRGGVSLYSSPSF